MRKLLLLASCFFAVAVLSGSFLVWSNVSEPVQSSSAIEGSPHTVATPRAVPSASATPKPTVVPTPVPTPDAPVEEWHFDGASLSIPRIGMVDQSISEYTADDLARNAATVYNGSNESTQVSGVNPPDKQAISWWSGAQDAGAILSSKATATVTLYGHAYQDGSAIFNGLVHLEYGDLVSITTYKTGAVDEVLTYEVVEKVRLYKGDVLSSSLQEPVAGRLLLMACYSGGQRDNTGHALEIDATVLQLKSDASDLGL